MTKNNSEDKAVVNFHGLLDFIVLAIIALNEDSYKAGRNFRYVFKIVIVMVSGFYRIVYFILLILYIMTIKCMDAEFYRTVYFVEFCLCSPNFFKPKQNKKTLWTQKLFLAEQFMYTLKNHTTMHHAGIHREGCDSD